MATSGELAELFQLCTQRGYHYAQQLHKYYKECQIKPIIEKIEVLSVNIYTYSVEEVKYGATIESKDQRVQAFTLENLTSMYPIGGKDSSEVINRYWLLLQNGTWKVDSVEVFMKDNSD